jgi:hypothetical protein
MSKTSYVAVCLLFGCIIVIFIIMYVYCVDLSILIVMYVPFCVFCPIVLSRVLFVWMCTGQLPTGYRGAFRLP